MANRTAVMNRALIKLGRERIADETEESEPARVMASIFDDLARTTLRSQIWSFAKARASLAALSTAPAFGWVRAFQLPSDFLRVVQVNDYWDFALFREATQEEVVPFEIEGRTLLTDFAAPLKLRYIRDVSSEVETWDASFVEAFSCRLASEACETLTKGSGTKKQILMKEYEDALREAKRCNAIELPPVPVADGSWLTARFAGI
jgi:hypothetical protein